MYLILTMTIIVILLYITAMTLLIYDRWQGAVLLLASFALLILTVFVSERPRETCTHPYLAGTVLCADF